MRAKILVLLIIGMASCKNEDECPKGDFAEVVCRELDNGIRLFRGYNSSSTLEFEGYSESDSKSFFKTVFYENGHKVSESNFLLDRMNGEQLLWWPNGRVRSKGNYIMGLKHGVFYDIDSLGNILNLSSYRLDTIQFQVDDTSDIGSDSISDRFLEVVFSDLIGSFQKLDSGDYKFRLDSLGGSRDTSK